MCKIERKLFLLTNFNQVKIGFGYIHSPNRGTKMGSGAIFNQKLCHNFLENYFCMLLSTIKDNKNYLELTHCSDTQKWLDPP